MNTLVKILVATALVAAPASLAIGTLAGGSIPFLSSATEEENPFGGAIIAEHHRAFEVPVTTGELDLRIDDGAVKVIGWDKDELLVRVLEVETDNETLSDAETTVTIDDRSTDEHLALSVVVDRDATYAVGLDAEEASFGTRDPDRAIVVYVPVRAHYTSVFACSGQDGALGEAFAPVEEVLDDLFGHEEDEELSSCVPADTTLGVTPVISINRGSGERLNVTSGVEGLRGESLTLSTPYDDLLGEGLVFAKAKLVTRYGELTLDGFEAGMLSAGTDYGDVTLVGTVQESRIATEYGDIEVEGRLTQASLVTEYGDVRVEGVLGAGLVDTEYGNIRLDILPEASGGLELTTEYGDVTVEVPSGPSYGYQVLAATDYGRIRVALEDAEVEKSRDGEDPGEPDWSGSGSGYDEEVHAKTEGFETKAIQYNLGITTEYGDILVTDGSLLSKGEADEDDEGHSVHALPAIGDVLG